MNKKHILLIETDPQLTFSPYMLAKLFLPNPICIDSGIPLAYPTEKG